MNKAEKSTRIFPDIFASTGLEKKECILTWKIHHFNLIKESDKSLIDSQGVDLTISAGKCGDCPTTWRIELVSYDEGEDKDWIGIFHKLKEFPSGKNIYSKFEVVIRDNKGTEEFYRQKTALKLMTTTKQGWGWRQVFKKQDSVPLEEDNALIMEVTLAVFTEKVADVRGTSDISLFEGQCAAKLLEDIESLYSTKKGTFCDVKIICADGVDLCGNKEILSARSPVFAAMFRSNLQENLTGVINLEDVSSKPMSAVLHYIHTGKLLHSELTSMIDIVDVVYVAEKYELSELHEFCDKLLAVFWDKVEVTEFSQIASNLRLSNTSRRMKEFFSNRNLCFESLHDIGKD